MASARPAPGISRREFLAGTAAAALGLWSCRPAAPSQPAPQASPAAEQPRYGGELVFAVDAEPPSLDAHRETTFALLHPFAPFYSTVLKFDQYNYPKVIGDLAESWTVSPDGLVYEFKLRDGVTFYIYAYAVGRRPDVSGRALCHAGVRAGEGSGVLAGYQPEPGGGPAAPAGGRRP